nr:hypothetical protein [Tanacetum cinerariifolium]
MIAASQIRVSSFNFGPSAPKSEGSDADTSVIRKKEYKEPWVGVEAYDSHIKENFTLRAALLWTINDFPAYSMLSGWTGKGYNACPTCMNETSSRYLHHSKKICYMGHQRFLPPSHQWRRDKTNFDGKVDYREQVAPKSGNEILNEIDYSLNTRNHIMHVVKNVTESLTTTIFNIKGKTKDTWKSHRDLMDERLKKSLHLRPQSNSSSLIVPMACYHLTKDEKQKILGFLKLLKFPNGYASNISRYPYVRFPLSGMHLELLETCGCDPII